MTRREYCINNIALVWLLYTKRIRCNPFRAVPSAREAHFCGVKRNNLHNKHTMGTSV